LFIVQYLIQMTAAVLNFWRSKIIVLNIFYNCF